MKSMRQSPIHAAVAAALVGLAGVVGTADAAVLSQTGTGQALIFPYYTVNAGWITTVNVMNTSEKTLAVKMRLHEKKNSRDVLDFVIIMSPNDVWTGWLQASDAVSAPQLFTNDNTCTSPLVVNGAKGSEVAYSGQFDDTGGTGTMRMRDGYVEMLVMGVAASGQEDLEANVVAYNAKHVDKDGVLTPRDCAKVNATFVARANWAPGVNPTATTGGGSGDPTAVGFLTTPTLTDNPLKGNVSWLQVGTGAGAGSTAIAVSEWADPTKNYVTAQNFPWFLEPTFASNAGLWTVTGVKEFENAVTYQATLNEWADNGATGAVTDWALTFPTKAYHVDKFNEQIQAAVSKYRNNLQPVVTCASNATDVASRMTCVEAATAPTAVAPFEYLFGVQGQGDSKVSVTYKIYDRSEGSIEAGDTSISPAPPGEIEALRYEANVIQFGAASVLGSPTPTVIPVASLLPGAKNGWAKILFDGADDGLPVSAFAVKARNQGNTLTNFGQAMDNAYEGKYDPMTPPPPPPPAP